MDKNNQTVAWLAYVTVGFITTLPLMVNVLAFLIVADMLTGFFRAIYERKLSPDEARRGASKKAVILIIVMGGHYIRGITGFPLDVGSVMAAFYAYSEVLSIMANCAAVGVQFPPAIQKVIENMGAKNDG